MGKWDACLNSGLIAKANCCIDAPGNEGGVCNL